MNNGTIGAAEKKIARQLEAEYGEQEATAIARIVMEHVTGSKPVHLLARKNERLSSEELRALEKILDELNAGIPMQYVLGETEFYGLKFKVAPAVLIPRQETVELVDWIIKENSATLQAAHDAGTVSGKNASVDSGGRGEAGRRGSHGRGTRLRILDIGTGSGCIAVALKKNLPHAEVWACDVSLRALDIARENAVMNRTEIMFRETDILNSRQWKDFPSFDIIVSNPPYVTLAEKQEMADHVLHHEPHLALFVTGSDPLLFYRQIASFAREKLRSGGKLYFEINEAFGEETLSLLDQQGFSRLQLRKDLNGKDRMISAQSAAV